MEAAPGAASGDRWQQSRSPDRRGAPWLRRVFFDSSAVAKRCIDESGTEQVSSLCERADELVLSVIALPESIAALSRLQREARLTLATYRQIKHDLVAALAALAEPSCATPRRKWLQRAVQAHEASTLRDTAAVHIGAAQEAAADVYVSAETRQRVAARAAGLPVGGL